MRTKPRLTAGTHVEHPTVTVHRAARVELSSPGVTTYADGEPVAPLPAVAECVPGRAAVVGTGRDLTPADRRAAWLTVEREPAVADPRAAIGSRGTRLTWGHVQPR